MRLFLLLLLTSFTAAVGRPCALAQGPETSPETGSAAQKYMMLPVTENDAQLARLRRVAEAVGQELSRRGLDAVPYADSAALFQQRHSREPHTVSRESIEALVQESQRASRAAAARHANETKQVVAEAQARGAEALESLNRDEAAARAYFSTCLALIRVLVANDERDAANKVARDCQAAVPDLAPNPHDHPPSVIQVFEDVQRMSAAEGLGTLYVESEPTDCRVLLNGRLVGTTPYTREAPLGSRYGVQVECGDPLPGRVHPVTIKATPTTAAVDVFFDRSLRSTRRSLRLSYPRPDPASARVHASEVARVLGADEVVLLASDDTGALELQLLRRGTSARLADDGEEELRRAVEAVLTAAPPEAAPVAEPPRLTARAAAPAAPWKPARWVLPTGAALTGLGIAAGIAGGLFFPPHVKDGKAFAAAGDEYIPPGETWQKSRNPYYGLIIGGSALSTAGGIMMGASVPHRHRRWLSPLLGAVGVGVLITGVVEMAGGRLCMNPDSLCIKPQEQFDRGALISIASVPFLASSIAQLVWLRNRSLSVHTTGQTVGATLRF